MLTNFTKTLLGIACGCLLTHCGSSYAFPESEMPGTVSGETSSSSTNTTGGGSSSTGNNSTSSSSTTGSATTGSATTGSATTGSTTTTTGGTTTTSTGGSGLCATDTWKTNIQAIMTSSCLSCHSGSLVFDASSQSSVTSSIQQIVDDVDSGRMPLGSTLSNSQITAIDNWQTCKEP